MDNTVGSRRKLKLETFYAYCAGFLDGDGCIAIRCEKRKSYRLGLKVRVRVSFTQHKRRRAVLDFLQEEIGSGTVAEYDHNHMAEYVIRDQNIIEELLRKLAPYIVVKAKHLKLALRLLKLKKEGYTPKTLKAMIKLSNECGKMNNYPKQICLTP